MEFLSVIRPVVVASLPLAGASTKGDTCVLSGDGHLYTFNGTAWVDNGAAGGAGTGASGKTVVDFGAHPGTTLASVAITGQGTIAAASSTVRAWIQAEATADHTLDEHVIEQLEVVAGNIVDGVGFTIYVRCNFNTTGQWTVAWRWE